MLKRTEISLIWGCAIALMASATAWASDPLRGTHRPLPDLSYLQCHQVFAARSDDGVNFRPDSQLIVDSATAPDAIVDGSGLRLYFVNGEAGKHGIWTMPIEESAGSWRAAPPQPITIDGAPNGDAVEPDVVRLPDGRLRLYYFLGFFVTQQIKPVPGMVERAHRILSAISNDGVNFTSEGRAIQIDAAEHPTVAISASGRYILALVQPRSQRVLIGQSSEGSRFVLNGVALTAGTPELVLLDDRRLRLFFADAAGIGSLASRDDGKNWEVEPGSRLVVKPPVFDPSVVRMASGAWRMFYRTVKPGCVKP